MVDESGDCNDPDCFFISLKYIFWRLVSPKSSKSAVPCSNSSPNFVKLSLPSNILKGLIVHVVLCAWCRCTEFCLLIYFSISFDWLRRQNQVDFWILSKGIDVSIGMSIYFILLVVFFVSLLMCCWSTSFCSLIVIRLCRCLANFMIPRISHSSACWHRWSSVWLAEFRFTYFNWFWANFRLLMIVLVQSLSMFTNRFIVLMIWFILSSFDILPNLCDFINFHRDTSRMALARSGGHGSRCSILLREASASSTHLMSRLSSVSIFIMSLLVSVLVFTIPFILCDCRIMSCCFTYA